MSCSTPAASSGARREECGEQLARDRVYAANSEILERGRVHESICIQVSDGGNERRRKILCSRFCIWLLEM